MAVDFNQILNRVKERRTLTGVARLQPLDVDIDVALKVMELIGRERNPKFVIDQHNRWAYTQLIKWLYGDETMQGADPEAAAAGQLKVVPGCLTSGLYIAGKTGTGKSWAMELLRIFADIDCPKVQLGDMTQRIVYNSYRAEDIWEECVATDTGLSKYKSMPILCIQDLGSEPVSDAVRMGTRREPLRQILEARGDRNDLITLVTSNFGICSPEIEKRYTDRVVSRLRGMCNMLVINGPDRRTF